MDIDAAIRRNVKVLAAGNDVRATTIYRTLNISRQTYSSRLAGSTRFTAAEVVELAGLLGTTVEQLAGSTEDLVAGQYWKKMNASDLEVIDGGDEGGQQRFGHLHLVT